MIEFVTAEVPYQDATVEGLFLANPDKLVPEDSSQVIVDGVPLDLPEAVIVSVARAINSCATIERQGLAVDCSVFGAIMLGGTYQPVDEDTYRHGLRREITLGDWLGEEELFGVAASTPKLVQFTKFHPGTIYPRHTAVKLPNTPNLYIQKLGHDLPITLSGAQENCRFHDADSVATVDRFIATNGTVPILDYTNESPHPQPLTTYVGQPG